MKKITEITRRDIMDVITDGFVVKELSDDYIDCDDIEVDKAGRYKIRMSYCGRLNEIDFLSRIYDLKNMPSTDYRYGNAYGDIVQHTVNNDDWGNWWFFSDGRFNLSHGSDDEYLLKFICQMLHPVVRRENGPWKEYAKKFNELLSRDGYELYVEEDISGREIYNVREMGSVTLVAQPERIKAPLKAIGEGSYANVYMYEDCFYQRKFALKRAKKDLSPKEMARFRREYEQMASMHSPYIIEVYSFDENSNEYIMEYMDQTLESYMRHHNDTMNKNQRKSIISQLTKGYQYLHSKSIFHRDVSVKNVLIKKYDDMILVKISDFGLVKIPESNLTSVDSELKGSFNDPSLAIRGFGYYDLLDEIYALTLLYVFIITGKTNFPSIKNAQVRKFMEKGTSQNRDMRYQTLQELRQGAIECLDSM